MSPYTISDPAKPHLIAFSAPTLEEVGAALRAQPDPWNLEIAFVEDGFARPLQPDELAELRRWGA